MTTAPSTSFETLCKQVKELLPEDLRDECWYLVTAASLVASGKPTELGNLYQHIISTEYSELNIEKERRLSERFSDLLMKEWTLVGIPTVLMGVSALAKVEKYVSAENTKLTERRYFRVYYLLANEKDKMSALRNRKDVDFNHEIFERGTAFIQRIYKQNLDPIFETWGSYSADFAWMEKAVIYGLFLSDHSVLSEVETQLVTLSSMMCQGYAGPALWHLRGLRRLGRNAEDVESVQRAIEAVAVWAGRSIEGWPRVGDVKDEL